MRKQAKKDVSSFPTDWHCEETERLIRGWLKHRELRGYGRDPDFMRWGAKTGETAKETFVYLLRKYRIQPFDILEILALYKSEEWFYTHLVVRKKLRSASLREKDAKALEKAALILDQWRDYLIQQTRMFAWNQYPEISHLEQVANALRDLGPSQRHRATEVRLRCCAQQLAQWIENHTPRRNPLYEQIGELMKAAFPKDWGAAGNKKEAAKKLVKGWDYRIREIDACDYPVWIVDKRLKIVHVNQSACRILGLVPWKTAGKDVNLIIRALFARTQSNSKTTTKDFGKAYSKVLARQAFEWKTVLTLEHNVENEFHQKEKKIIDYNCLVQREIRSLSSPGTATYLTERQPVKEIEESER